MNAHSTLQIRVLEKNRWEEITAITVEDRQKDYIESSSHCLNDAKTSAYGINWNFYGIFLGESPLCEASHKGLYAK